MLDWLQFHLEITAYLSVRSFSFSRSVRIIIHVNELISTVSIPFGACDSACAVQLAKNVDAFLYRILSFRTNTHIYIHRVDNTFTLTRCLCVGSANFLSFRFAHIVFISNTLTEVDLIRFFFLHVALPHFFYTINEKTTNAAVQFCGITFKRMNVCIYKFNHLQKWWKPYSLSHRHIYVYEHAYLIILFAWHMRTSNSM